jgi:hypothetical protein
MDDMTRRGALAIAAGAAAWASAQAGPAGDGDKPKAEMTDRDRIMASGLTEAEADCWEAVAQAAGKFFALPKLHTMDDHEVSHAVHVLQYRLLSRPAYRKYLELSKAANKK